MGAYVVAARHLALGELVALKILRSDLARDGETVERFLREARAAVRIKAEQVVRVLDVGRCEDGSPYIAMEYLDGIDLAARVRERGPLSVADAVDCVLQTCVAIAEAHALGIVHRDLKPSNLFLTLTPDARPLVKVLDFGISKFTGAADHAITGSRALFGSPAYMSPEQVRNAKDVDGRTDIWSLGIVLYELLTGQTPFCGLTVPGLLVAVVSDPPRRLDVLRPDAPAALQRVLDWCLAKDVSRRCPSAQELARALQPFAAKQSAEWLERMLRLTPPAPAPPAVPPPPPSSTTAITLSQSSGPPPAFDMSSRSLLPAPPPSRIPSGFVIGAGAMAGVASVLLALLIHGARPRARPAAPTTGQVPPPATATSLPQGSAAPAPATTPAQNTVDAAAADPAPLPAPRRGIAHD
jgi:serine/threonine-protein kinase